MRRLWLAFWAISHASLGKLAKAGHELGLSIKDFLNALLFTRPDQRILYIELVEVLYSVIESNDFDPIDQLKMIAVQLEK